MKLFISLLAFTVPTFAHSFPTVGDQATYALNGSIEGTQIMEVISVDLEKGTLLARETTASFGRVQTHDHVRNIADEKKTVEASSSAEACAKFGGFLPGNVSVLEAISVLGQNLSTCHVKETHTSNSGQRITDLWFGDVPFGILKAESQGPGASNHLTVTLTGFKKQ